VVQLGRVSAEQALEAVQATLLVDGPMGIKAEAPRLLTRPDVLETLGVVKDMEHVPLVVESVDGTR